VAIGWLSGALTTLSVLLYAFGYLATRAHLTSLGIDGGFLTYDNPRLLLCGVGFVIDSVSLLGTSLIYVWYPLLLLAGGSALVGMLLQRGRMARLRAALDRMRPWYPHLSYGALVVVLAGHLEPALGPFRATLGVVDRLYESHLHLRPTGDADVDAIREALQTCNRGALAQYYASLLGVELLAVLLLIAAANVTASWRFHTLLVAPFGIVVLLYSVLLPMAYGVLRMPERFSTVRMVGGGDLGGEVAGTTYRLMGRTEREVMLWDPGRRRVVCLPADHLRGMMFIRPPSPVIPCRLPPGATGRRTSTPGSAL
jgi:hypothetical protein